MCRTHLIMMLDPENERGEIVESATVGEVCARACIAPRATADGGCEARGGRGGSDVIRCIWFFSAHAEPGRRARRGALKYVASRKFNCSGTPATSVIPRARRSRVAAARIDRARALDAREHLRERPHDPDRTSSRASDDGVRVARARRLDAASRDDDDDDDDVSSTTTRRGEGDRVVRDDDGPRAREGARASILNAPSRRRPMRRAARASSSSSFRRRPRPDRSRAPTLVTGSHTTAFAW